MLETFFVRSVTFGCGCSGCVVSASILSFGGGDEVVRPIVCKKKKTIIRDYVNGIKQIIYVNHLKPT